MAVVIRTYHPHCIFHAYSFTAQIICCTCIGSGGDILDGLGPLERVLVDEATQATEAAVLVPLMRGCKQLVLVGDHCQLPPTVLSTRAEEEGHGVPLFSRMVACGVPPYMLDTQVRHVMWLSFCAVRHGVVTDSVVLPFAVSYASSH